MSDERWKDVRLFCYRIDTSGGRFSTYEEEVGGLGIKIDEFGVDGIPDKSIIDQRARRMEEVGFPIARKNEKTIIPLYMRIKEYKPSIVHSWQDGMNIDASIAAMIAGVPNIIMFARSMRQIEDSPTYQRRSIWMMHIGQYLMLRELF